MGILTIGLLGVAAIFPVGSFYMQKGDIADRGSAIAQAAFNETISPRRAQSGELAGRGRIPEVSTGSAAIRRRRE